MTFIPTPGAVRTDIQFTMAGQQVHNIIWCSRDGTWTQVQREALNDAVAAWWNTSARQYFSGSLGLVQVTTVNQESQSAPASTLVVSPVVYGTQAGATPMNVACCATLRTDLRGRNFRGRMYLAGIPAAKSLTEATMATDFIANVILALTALKTAIEALGALWVVVSKYTNKTARANGLKTPITAIAVDQYFDSQRRRLGLRGV